jgi:hypothetical protein
MLKIDPMRHRKPGFNTVKWQGQRVFDMLLCVSSVFNLNGKLPPSFWAPEYLVKEFGITESDLRDPVDWVKKGLSEIIAKGIVDKLAGDDATLSIPEWSQYLASSVRAVKSKRKDDSADPETCETSKRWNRNASQLGLSEVLQLSPKRLEQGAKAWAEWGSKIDAAIAMIGRSDFLMGKNDRQWKADFDWFIRPGSIAKILEGKYDNKQQQSAVKLVNVSRDLYE